MLPLIFYGRRRVCLCRPHPRTVSPDEINGHSFAMLLCVKQMGRVGLWGAIAVVGCSSPQSAVEGPVVIGTASEPSAPLPVSSDPVPSADSAGVSASSALPSATVASLPPFEKRFLPHDFRCEKDADCAVTKRGVGERTFCCDACDAAAGSKAWVARADLRCSVYDKESARHTCPPRDCTAPRGARCFHGACERID